MVPLERERGAGGAAVGSTKAFGDSWGTGRPSLPPRGPVSAGGCAEGGGGGGGSSTLRPALPRSRSLLSEPLVFREPPASGLAGFS